jgi:hypothetical protein
MTDICHVDFYGREWIEGTLELTLAERGMLITAEALICSRGEPVTVDHLHRVCGVHGRTFKTVLGRLLALGKLFESDGKIGSKRAEKELKKARNRLEKWSKNLDNPTKPNGYDHRAGGNARASNHQSPEVREDTLEPRGSNGAGAPSDREPVDLVKALFDRGKEVLGQKSGDVLGKMRRQYGDVAVLDAIVACEDTSPSNPVAFFVAVLNRRNGHAAKLSPVAKLYAGAYEAGEEWDRRQGNCGDRYSLDGALLDSGRPH